MSTEVRATESVAGVVPIRDEWVAIVDALYHQVEGWAKALDWATRRDPEWFDEPGLGRYQVWRLLVHAPEGRLVFKPVARRVTGAQGLIDLFVLPSYDPMLLVRHDDGEWRIHSFADTSDSRPWAESTFVALAREMFARA